MKTNNIIVKNEIDEATGVYTKMPESSLKYFQPMMVNVEDYSKEAFVSLILNTKGELYASAGKYKEVVLASIKNAEACSSQSIGDIVYAFLSEDGVITDGWHYSPEIIL